MHFWAILLTPPISWSKITTSETIYTCAEDYLKEAFPKIPGQCKVSFIVFGPWKCIFKLFLLKNGHNSVENYHTGKNLHLCWRLPVRSFL